MEKALAAAYGNIGKTSPNPSVGAVIVKDGLIISEGVTCPYGQSHAEIMAIASAGDRAPGADMYISLEPCDHQGNTPPCTKAMIEAGIAGVYIPILDPNPLVSGKGVKRLTDAGVRVQFLHEYESHAADLIRPFKKYILRKKPFVIGKSALTLDGRIAAPSGDSKWITSEFSRYLVHRLRAKVDAVMVGKNTFAKDRPGLRATPNKFGEEIRRHYSDNSWEINGRYNFFLDSLLKDESRDFNQPLRIIAGLPEDINPEDDFFWQGDHLIFENKKSLDRLITKNKDLKSILGRLDIAELEDGSPAEAVQSMLEFLYKRGIMLILLEGGSVLNGSFYDAGEIDQYLYFIAPRIAGGGLSPVSGTGAAVISDSLRLHDVSSVMIRDEVLITGYKEPYNFESM